MKIVHLVGADLEGNIVMDHLGVLHRESGKPIGFTRRFKASRATRVSDPEGNIVTTNVSEPPREHRESIDSREQKNKIKFAVDKRYPSRGTDVDRIIEANALKSQLVDVIHEWENSGGHLNRAKSGNLLLSLDQRSVRLPQKLTKASFANLQKRLQEVRAWYASALADEQ